MIREISNAIVACLVSFVVCAVAYPFAVWAVGSTLFPHQAAGSLIERDGKVIGSELIAQPFASDKYFQPRPSAAGSTGYSADAASGSNLGTKNPALRERIVLDVAKQLAAHDDNAALKAKLDALDSAQTELKAKNDLKEKSEADTKAIKGLEDRVGTLKSEIEAALVADHSVKVPVPVDLVTTSGAGLDPDISEEGARFQAPRVAAARGIGVDKVNALIEANTNRSGAIIGAPARVNVLKLNLILDKDAPEAKAKASASPTTPAPALASAKPALDVTPAAPAPKTSAPETKPAAVAMEPVVSKPAEDDTAALSRRLDEFQRRLDANPSALLVTQVKELRDRVERLASESKLAVESARKVDEIADRTSSNERGLKTLRDELKTGSDKSAASLSENIKAVRNDMGGFRNDLRRIESIVMAVSAKPKEEKPRREADITPALKLFQAKQYAAASAAFKTLTASAPDDARVWYYAALANGLATGQWLGESEALVNKGIERERAGTPEPSAIDAAFTGLAKETGAEWLKFYRQQAAAKH